jgi:hypothetical protein
LAFLGIVAFLSLSFFDRTLRRTGIPSKLFPRDSPRDRFRTGVV